MRILILSLLTLTFLQLGCASTPEAEQSEPVATPAPVSTETLSDAGPGRTELPLPKSSDDGMDSGPSIVLKKADGTTLPSRPEPTIDPKSVTASEPAPILDTEKLKALLPKSSAAEAALPPEQPDHQDEAKAEAPTPVPTGIDPEVALRYLRNGNTRFRKSQLRKDGQSTKDIRRVASNQKPHSIILTSSDSRIPPEVIFDQKLGEIYVLRTPGQSLSPESLAGIEQAVGRFGTRLILVLGLSNDDFVNTASAGGEASSANQQALAAQLNPRLEKTMKDSANSTPLALSWANVRGAAREIFQKSPRLQEALRLGQIRVVGAVYDLQTGAVDFK